MSDQPASCATSQSLAEKRRAFEENRYRWSDEQLRPYFGNWLAFSGDGKRILAHAEKLSDVERQLLADGFDPQEVWFEHLVSVDDSWSGGAELEML